MKLASAWILLNAVLAQGRPRSLGEVDLAMNAAEGEVAARIDAVIERAKAVEGWDIRDVVSKVNVGVNEILDAHSIEGATKEKAMDHLDNKLSKMLEEISAEKEVEGEVAEEELEAEMNAEGTNAEAMNAAESEVAAHMDAVIERAKAVEGWEISDVVSKVGVRVNEILDAHSIDGATKEKAMDHLNNKLSKMLEEISAEKEVEEEVAEEELEAEMNAEGTNAEAMNAAEAEVAARIDAVIERARAVEGWDISHVVSKVNAGVNEILDAHSIDGATKEKAMDHLDNKLFKMLEEISAEKEVEGEVAEEELEAEMNAEEEGVANEKKLEEDYNEIMNAVEGGVAAIMTTIVEKAKAGNLSEEYLTEAHEAVIAILDGNGVEGALEEKVMEQLRDKLGKTRKEIYAEKEVEEGLVDEKKLKAATNTEAMNAAEDEVAAHMDAVIERAKAVEGWDIRDVVSKVNVGVNEILDAHGIEGAMKEKAMDHLDNKLSNMLEEISAEKKFEINF